MKGDVIDKASTVARYCGFKKLTESGRASSRAWELVEKDLNDDNPHVSVNWLEFFKGKTRAQQMDCIRKAFIEKRYTLAGRARFALAKVAEINEKMKEDPTQHVSVRHWPEENDPSHSGIFFKEAEREAEQHVMALRLSQMNCEMVPAKGSEASDD